MYEKIITLNNIEYKLSSDTPISQQLEQLTLQKLGIQTLTATCTPTVKIVGQTITLNCTATSGVSPFTMTFKKNGVVLATRTGVVINTPATPVTDVATAADATTGYAIYSTVVTDNCTDPSPQTTTESCTVTIHAPCVSVQATFSVT